MIVIVRNRSAWLTGSATEAFEVQAVSLRLQGKNKDFKVFEQRLDAGEHIDAGVIKVYKCSESSKCKECDKYKDCPIREKVRATAQAQAEFARLVDDNDGYMLY